MSYEIEIKAHIDSSYVETLKSEISKLDNSKNLGQIDKTDIYWSFNKESESSMFRTRLEKTDIGTQVLFTAKPCQTNNSGTEYNIENEFSCNSSEWDKIMNFCSGLGLVPCRRKYKSGFNYMCTINNVDVHIELLNVKFLGWFLEMEVCTDDGSESFRTKSQSILFEILDRVGVSRDKVENKSYKSMLLEAGHLLG